MITAMGARRQPLTFIITTAGVYDPESIGWEMHTHAQQVLDGIIEDDTFFAIIFAMDEGDDWKDPASWYKANPNLDVSVKMDYLKEQCDRAIKTPSFLNTFLRLHLNQWTQQVTRWISVDRWNECSAAVPPLESMQGRVAYMALDLSTKIDMCALACALPDGDVYDFFWRFYVPHDLVLARTQAGKKPDYAAWVRSGWVVETPGNVIDYDFIRKDILRLRGILRIRQLGFDPWNATHLITQLAGDGFSVDPTAKQEQLIEMRQGMRTLSEPSKEFEKLVLSRRIRHGGNPVMSWMVDNAAIRRDANDNIAPDKRSAVGKIDGLVASIMALGRAILEPSVKSSIYATRGVRTL
jgi:phage terminase large subunit-like protein